MTSTARRFQHSARAVPKIRSVGSFLMAVQVKDHRGNRTTGRPEVDRMLTERFSLPSRRDADEYEL
jgi:hypothetical protein